MQGKLSSLFDLVLNQGFCIRSAAGDNLTASFLSNLIDGPHQAELMQLYISDDFNDPAAIAVISVKFEFFSSNFIDSTSTASVDLKVLTPYYHTRSKPEYLRLLNLANAISILLQMSVCVVDHEGQLQGVFPV